MRVPFLSRAEIAQAAEGVLAGYGEQTGEAVMPPVPVEEILESYLGLHYQYLDLERITGVAGALGATYVQKKFVVLSNTLLAERSRGRAAFTLAHEAGHWVLHRQYVKTVTRTDGPKTPETIFCRARDAKKPMEWQADYFASCLLLPESAVRTAFAAAFAPGTLEVINTRETFSSSAWCFDICADNWPYIAGAVCEAGGFGNVSRQAMIIRLQELGLVVNHTPQVMGWKRSLLEA